ncbi:MAG: alpha/beta fold hydrolase [Gammaproteobacteria bacterium]|nr:alpha/beta fold hydrolase [Gammaproteobacteria bacterium]
MGSFLFVIVLSGCAGLPATETGRIDDRSVEYAQITQAAPVVVFENGLAASMKSWSKVFPEIGKDATVFAYNRPSYGDSDPVATPRDGAHVVAELRVLLRHKGMNPPYVLVGHSLGGLYMQLFARRYPDEVAGLVLVDSTHPAQFDGFGALENWPFWTRMLKLFLTDLQKQELAAAKSTGLEVLHAPPFIGKPIIILSAIQDSTSEMAQFVKEKQTDFVRLYPGSRQLWIDSGHFIQQDKPEVVITAIRDILAQYRSTAGNALTIQR